MSEEEFYSHHDLVRIVLIDQNGSNPSIVTRVNRLEMFRTQMQEREDNRQKWTMALVLLTIGQTLMLIAGLVSVLLKH